MYCPLIPHYCIKPVLNSPLVARAADGPYNHWNLEFSAEPALISLGAAPYFFTFHMSHALWEVRKHGTVARRSWRTWRIWWNWWCRRWVLGESITNWKEYPLITNLAITTNRIDQWIDKDTLPILCQIESKFSPFGNWIEDWFKKELRWLEELGWTCMIAMTERLWGTDKRTDVLTDGRQILRDFKLLHGWSFETECLWSWVELLRRAL